MLIYAIFMFRNRESQSDENMKAAVLSVDVSISLIKTQSTECGTC